MNCHKLFILDIITEESKKKVRIKSQKTLFRQKTDFFTKNRPKWARGLLNRPKAVKTDQVNNTATAHSPQKQFQHPFIFFTLLRNGIVDNPLHFPHNTS